MRLDRLQGVPKRTPVAVINDQRNASVLGDAVPNALDDGLRWGTGFHKITLFGVRQPIRKCGVRRSLGPACCFSGSGCTQHLQSRLDAFDSARRQVPKIVGGLRNMGASRLYGEIRRKRQKIQTKISIFLCFSTFFSPKTPENF